MDNLVNDGWLMMIGWRNQIGLLSWRILARKSRPRLKNHGDWRIEKWVVESSTHDEATKQWPCNDGSTPIFDWIVQSPWFFSLNHREPPSLWDEMLWGNELGAGRLHKGQQNHFGGQIPISHNFPACWFQQLVLMIFDVPNMNTAWPLATCQWAGWSPKQFDPLKGPK